MSTYMNHELLLFFCAVGTGIGLLFLYDWIRIFRKLLSHGELTVSLLDFFFWILAGILIFILIYRKNDGVVRSYVLVGIIGGMLLYVNFVGNRLVQAVVAVGEIPINFTKKVIKGLISCAKRCNIDIYRLFRRIKSRQRVFWQDIWKKRTKKSGQKSKHKSQKK